MKDSEKKNSHYLFGGIVKRVCNEQGNWSLRVVWARLLIFILLLLVFLYLLLSVSIFSYFKYFREYKNMSFVDSARFLFARAEYREKMGNYDIEKAKEYLQEGKIREAFSCLVTGCGRSPKNLEGVKLLAQLHLLAFHRADRAIETLERSLTYAINDVDYIRLYMRILMDQTEDARIISAGEKILNEPSLTNNDSKMYLAMTLSTVYAYHGNYVKSEKYIKDFSLEKTLPGILRLSKNQWELGNRDVAMQILNENIDNISGSKEAVYALMVNYYIAMKDFDSARRYSVLRGIENPNSMEQRMEYMTLLKRSGDAEAVKADMEIFFNKYQNDNRSMLYLANFAADIGDVKFMRRIYDLALRKDFPVASYCLLLLETTITKGEYKAAVAFVEDIMKEKPKWKDRHEDVILCLRAVSYYAVGNSNMADILINDIIKSNKISAKVLIATARMFDKLGGYQISLSILERACSLYPKHQLALTRLIQAELKIGISTNIQTNIAKLLKMRRPPRELIAEARKSICSDKFIFANEREEIIKEIDTLMNNKDGRAFSDSEGSIDSERIIDSDLNF